MINPRGGYKKLDFEFNDDTVVYNSCSLRWKNLNYVFGGINQERQVSMVNGYRLERKATLDFDFRKGGCTVLNEQIVVLCFHRYETKVCRQSNNPLALFAKLPDANYKHYAIRTASYDGKKILFIKKF